MKLNRHGRRRFRALARKSLQAALLAFGLAGGGHAFAQSSPGLSQGQVPTAGQWNSYFAAKQDYLNFTPLNVAGGTMLGPLTTTPSNTGAAGFSISPGVAPTSPVNGNLWLTTLGLYAQVNGSTVGPFGAGLGSGTSGGIPYYNTTTSVLSSAALTANLPVIGGGAGSAPGSGSSSGNTTEFMTGSGAFINGHCLQINASGNVVDAGGACTTGGGGGTVTSGTAGQLAGYSSSGTTVVGFTLGSTLGLASTTVNVNPNLVLTTGTLNGAAATTREFIGQTAAVTRWVLALGDATAESGTNAGSNFDICDYADGGTLIGCPLFINRASGKVGFGTASPAFLGDFQGGAGTGISVTASGTTNGPLLILNASGTNGHKWELISEQASDAQGAGALGFYDATASATRGYFDTSGNLNIANGNITSAAGYVSAFNGFAGRPGQGGAADGHYFNLDWTGSQLNAWYDTTELGAVGILGASAQYTTFQANGAAGNGTTDDTTAVNTTINLGKPIWCSGTFKITSAVSASLTTSVPTLYITGGGRNGCIILQNGATAELEIFIANATTPFGAPLETVHIEHVTFSPDAVMTSPSVYIQGPTGALGDTEKMLYWNDSHVIPASTSDYSAYGIYMLNVSNFTIENSVLQGSQTNFNASAGIDVTSNTGQPPINFHITNNLIAWWNIGTYLQPNLNGTTTGVNDWEGAYLDGNVFLANNVCVFANSVDFTSNLINISNGHCNFATYGFEINNVHLDLSIHHVYLLESPNGSPSAAACVTVTIGNSDPMYGSIDDNMCDFEGSGGVTTRSGFIGAGTTGDHNNFHDNTVYNATAPFGNMPGIAHDNNAF